MHRIHQLPPRATNFEAARVIARQAVPFPSLSGETFVQIPAGRGFRALPLRSPAFRDWFYGEYFAEHETLPTAHAFRQLRDHLDAQAVRLSSAVYVPRRVDASAADKFLLDLANPLGEFVEISPEGWHVATSPDVAFETSAAARPLPTPEPSPDPQAALDALRAALNLGPPDGPDWLRCLAWLAAALNPSGPYPILVLRGPTQAGKSFAARILRALVDPAASPFNPTPASPRQLENFARESWLLSFDHVSRFSDSISDTLCRLSTGIGIARRLEGRPETLRQWIKRPILLTVTERWEPTPDLAARCLFVTLPEIPVESRRPESALLESFDSLYSQILGALCSLLSASLRGALPAFIGCTPQAWHDALTAPPPPHPIVDSIRALLAETPRWTGSATDLQDRLRSPESTIRLSKLLHQHAPALARAGVEVAFHRTKRIRQITLSKQLANSTPSLPKSVTLPPPLSSLINDIQPRNSEISVDFYDKEVL